MTVQITLKKVVVASLIILSIYYIFFSRFNTEKALWTNETFKDGKQEGLEGTTLDPSAVSLGPPATINNVHDHPSLYKYLGDIETNVDKLIDIYKSKDEITSNKTTPSTKPLSSSSSYSRGLSPAEYAQWSATLPDVFQKPLYTPKVCSNSLNTAAAGADCQAPPPSSCPPSSPCPPPTASSQTAPPSQTPPPPSQMTSESDTITVNIVDSSSKSKSKKKKNKEGMMPPMRGYASFNQYNDVKWSARNDDNYAGGADYNIERPG